MKARALLLAGLGVALALASGCRSTASAPPPLPFPLRLEFTGQESEDEDELRAVVQRELARLAIATPDKAAVDDAAFALELHYRGRGHPDVRVDYAFEPGAEPRATFRIAEGPRVRVLAIELEGPEALAPAAALRLLEPLESGSVFDQTRLDAGLARLEDYYRKRGHLRIAFEPPEVEYDEARTGVTIRMRLREGPIFRVRTLEFEGGVPALQRREGELARQYTGSLLRSFVAPEIEHALVEAYRRSGYPDAEVRVQAVLDEASGDVQLKGAVRPGELARIAHVRIEGNARTKDAAILNELDVELGSLYDSEELRTGFRKLYATGLFESIDLELEGGGEERTLVVRVEEARSVKIRVEPGYGSYEGPRVLLGIEENNFRGRGQIVALVTSASLKAKAARIGWIDRDFLGSSLTSETSFFAEEREEPSFTFVRRGFGFFLRRAWGEHWSSSLGYEFRPTDVTDDNVPALSPDLNEDTNVAALSTGLAYDTRDNLLLPSRGEEARVRFEWADDGLGSDTEFLRAQLDLTRLWPMGDENVLVAALRTGVITPFGRTDVIPLPERFFNGGENSVRSFREDELLPAGVSGDPVGGETATTLNLELRRLLSGNLATALFADTGNVSEDFADYLDFDGFQSGYGVGLRYLLPIGPVRLDLGWNPRATGDEDDYVLHFSVGFPF